MLIAQVTLAVRDVRRTSAFFCTALGWKPVDRPNDVPLPAAWLEIGPGQEFHLIEVAGFEPSAFERELGRHVAVAHRREAFAGLKERLGLRETPFERFFFRTPDGYLEEVVAAPE
jgi:catechol 2,3-dioxygenase-like lactoylglutathione lyase family enzyme